MVEVRDLSSLVEDLTLLVGVVVVQEVHSVVVVQEVHSVVLLSVGGICTSMQYLHIRPKLRRLVPCFFVCI